MWLNELLNRPPAHRRQWVQQAAFYAERLQGVSSVALWFEDTALLAAALLGAWQAGAEVRLLPNLQADALEWADGADCLLTDTDVAHAKTVWSDKPPVAPADGSLPPFTLTGEETVWLQTSGSGGRPKIVGKTAAQMAAEAQAIADILPPDWRGLPALASISAQHLYGLTFRVFTALNMDWTLEADTCRYPEDFTAATRQPCIWLTSPAVLTHFGGQRDWARLRGCVRGIVSAGGALPEQTAQLLAGHLQQPVLNIYGSTESGVIARQFATDTHRLFSGVRVRHDEQGQLCVHSAWSGGEQIMADAADIDGDRLMLHGRSDRIVKLADKRISLQHIEHALLHSAWVADAHCLLWQQRVAAWLALNDAGIGFLRANGRAALLDALRQELGATVEAVARPRYWRLAAGVLPRNAQAKIRADDAAQAFSSRPDRPDWQWVGQTENEWCFSGCVPLDLRYFNGHFATFPLVPGVVQLQWAVDLARRFACGGEVVAQVENLKYQQFIRPNDTVRLTLRWDAAKGKTHFALYTGDKTCSSGRLVWHSPPQT